VSDGDEGRGALWYRMRREALGQAPCVECECIPHRVWCSRKADSDRFYELDVQRAERRRAEWEATEQTYRETAGGGPQGAPWN
jgi:hypothetical protein